jgi:NOL1/NOP2/fmu family ribosome biogenesis protein
MFLEQAILQMADVSKPLKVLDLCAAPGGKSTHLQSLVSRESLLVSNEVIRSRSNILKDNIIKWGCSNVIVTNNDPSDFTGLTGYFDIIVIDAPCSGSGLFRKDAEAIEEWSVNNVILCSQRQHRILADILPALKTGGIIIYSTCSYSAEEDEQVADWFVQSFPVEYRPLKIEPGWGIVDTGKGYRFWPDKLKGEGLFLSCFQKTGEEEAAGTRSKQKLEPVTAKEKLELEKWLNVEGISLWKHENKVYAWPANLVSDFHFIMQRLRVLYSGVFAGEFMREKFIPAHPLAMSVLLMPGVPRIELNKTEAIRYLQRKTPELDIGDKGWQVVTYNDFVLGWINVVPGRINNYYPKELRIIKDN